MPTIRASRREERSNGQDTGLASNERRMVAERLLEVLNSTYALLLKTHVCHWNVVGPDFLSIHKLTEAQYKNLFEATDELAERVRALGHSATLDRDQLAPEGSTGDRMAGRGAIEMVTELCADHEHLVRRIREAGEAADEVGDLATADLLTARLAFHEKAIWMLRATAS